MKRVPSIYAPIRKEHLLPEDSFIHYCRRDELDGRKLDNRVTSEFLNAAEKDALIVPLLTEKQRRKRGDAEEEVDIRYAKGRELEQQIEADLKELGF